MEVVPEVGESEKPLLMGVKRGGDEDTCWTEFAYLQLSLSDLLRCSRPRGRYTLSLAGSLVREL